MKISVYNSQLERVAYIEENYISLFWKESYNDVGAFSLEIPATEKNRALIKPDYFVGAKERSTLMVVKNVDVGSKTLVATGYSSSYLLDDAAFIGTIQSNGVVTQEIKNAYQEDNAVPLFYIADSDIKDKYNEQISNKSILELLRQMCGAADIGFRSVKDGQAIRVEFYKPEVNPNLKFSPQYGNIKEASLFFSSLGYKNHAIVLGQGEGENRARVDVDIRLDPDDQKRTLIIDARDLQREKEESEDNYIARMRARGLENLINQQKRQTVDFLPHNAGFGKRFDLGDVLTVLLPEYNARIQTRIVSVSIKSQRNISTVSLEVSEHTDVSNVLSFSSGNMSPSVGGDGTAGEPGADGVGIASVEQTTTSTADNGINVVTVTKTDGTSSTFQVRNGSKGSTGEKGDQGEQGLQGPQGTKGEAGPAGPQGEKGDTGPQGPQGEKGATGATPQLTIGTVSTLSAGSNATATITGTTEKPVLNLGIPKGADGADGEGGSVADLPDNLVYLNEEEESVQLLGIVDLVYPVGSIYMSVNDASPAVLFGGTWEQIGQGRTLWGAGNGYTPGTTVEAGLPNITGQYAMDRNASSLLNGDGKFAGAFTSKATLSNSTNGVQYRASTNGLDLAFDASLSNPIYGNSTTVQPPAFVVYMWQRTA